MDLFSFLFTVTINLENKKYCSQSQQDHYARKLYYLLLGVMFCLVRRGVSVTDGSWGVGYERVARL